MTEAIETTVTVLTRRRLTGEEQARLAREASRALPEEYETIPLTVTVSERSVLTDA